MLEPFQPPSARERLGTAGAFVERVPAATEVLIVGASRDAADDLARRVTAARRATFGLHRASLTQLAVRFAAGHGARGGGGRRAGELRGAAGAGARVLRASCEIPRLCPGAR